jgi:hypothetical protein
MRSVFAQGSLRLQGAYYLFQQAVSKQQEDADKSEQAKEGKKALRLHQ